MAFNNIQNKALKNRRLYVENQRLLEENKRLHLALLTDDLTGLHNARCLREKLDWNIKNYFQGGEVPALLFIDVDHFKEINEKHGHWAAGNVLSQVGAQIASQVRLGDIAFRYGGDEFVVLVGGGLKGAQLVGERIRQNIEKHPFEIKTGLQGPSVEKLTVSIGIRVIQPGDSVQYILDEADRAMYEAKRKSRNRLVVSDEVFK